MVMALNQDSPRVRRTLHLGAALLPLLAIFLVAALGIFLQRVNAATEQSLTILTRPFAPGCGDVVITKTRDELRFAGGFFSFTAATQLLLVTQIAVAIFAIFVIARMLKSKRQITVALSLSLAAGTVAATLPGDKHAPTTMKLLELLQRCTGVDTVLITQERCGAFVATLLACALCALLLRGRQDDLATTSDLSRRFSGLAGILYAGTLLLVVSLLRLSALYDWVGAAPGVDAKDVEPLAAGLLRVWGVYYTTILAAVYLPASLVLHRQAHRLAEDAAPVDVEARTGWLKRHGLSTGVGDTLPRILAILAPILVGELKQLVDLL